MDSREKPNKDAQLLRQLIDTLPYYVFWKNKDLSFGGCNKMFAEQFGFKEPFEIVGKQDKDFPWPDEFRAKYNRDDTNVIKTGVGKVNYEEAQTQSDGSIRTVLVSKVPLYDEDNQVGGVLGIYTDITDRKQMELSLKKATEKAECANRVKSEFIANMSHDLRTPLTGILGLAQSLKETASNESNRQDANLLISSAEELLTLLNEIIELVDIESGELDCKQELFNLKQLLMHNIHLFSPSAQHKSLKLELDMASSLPTQVIGRRMLLDRIILNLLGNAIKFTHQGSVTLSAHINEQVDDTVFLEIVVADTGIGIPRNKIETIFDHFSRLTPSFHGLYKGSGLGLYTVKRYLEVMGGHIAVQSKLGEGSQFVVTVPLSAYSPDSHALDLDQMMAIEESEQEADSRDIYGLIKEGIELQKIDATVLVIEDHPLAARMAADILKKMYARVEVASDGNMALVKTRLNHYDLIYCDIGLPDIDGVTVAETIIDDIGNINRETPIVALTAHIEQMHRERCLAAGIQDVIAKPLTTFRAYHHLKQYINHSVTDELPTADVVNHQVRDANMKDIDLNYGATLINGGCEEAKELLVMLVKTLPQDYADIQKAYSERDREHLYKAIHRLYGSLCYCGVPKLRYRGNQLKLMVQTVAWEELDSTYQGFCGAVEDFVKAYGAEFS